MSASTPSPTARQLLRLEALESAVALGRNLTQVARQADPRTLLRAQERQFSKRPCRTSPARHPCSRLPLQPGTPHPGRDGADCRLQWRSPGRFSRWQSTPHGDRSNSDLSVLRPQDRRAFLHRSPTSGHLRGHKMQQSRKLLSGRQVSFDPSKNIGLYVWDSISPKGLTGGQVVVGSNPATPTTLETREGHVRRESRAMHFGAGFF